jgi:hypothetical protein
MGAIEFLAVEIREGSERIADALAKGLTTIAENVRSDHPLQGETLDGIKAELSSIAEAIGENGGRTK